MPKFDFSRIKRRTAEVSRFELTDPAAPDQAMEVWLKPLDEVAQEAVETRIGELLRQYVTGGFHHANGIWQAQPMPYPPIDGQAVKLTREFIRLAARLEVMQAAPAREGALTFDELVQCAVLTPLAWRSLQAFALGVQREYEAQGESGKEESSSGPSGEQSPT